VARSVPQIYAALDNNQADHQASVVEIEGMIFNHLVSILIDPGSNLSYIAPKAVDKCKLQPQKQTKPWLVQLATGTKRRVAEAIPACQLMLGEFPTQETLNILPLGSYDLLIGMDWLAAHKARLDCYHKTLECVSKEGKRITLPRDPKTCLGEANISPANEKVLPKRMSPICNTGVENNRR
jgi:hypothetical protein